jgi:hypothetical protein
MASAATLAAGHVKYIALDRIPARPLPVRQHELDPVQRSHPDVGVAIIHARCAGRKAGAARRCQCIEQALERLWEPLKISALWREQ